MTRVSEAAKLYVPAERVWETIGDFAGIGQWHPGILACEESRHGTQLVRSLDIGAGAPLVERLSEHDDAAMRYAYVLLDGPLPVRAYEAALQVHRDDAASCTVEWNAAFEPAGATPEEAVRVVRAIYRKGLDHLRFTLAG